MSRKTQRVVLNAQAREIVSKVYDFMKKEANSNYAEKLTDARWRASQAVGVSESTITRILRERREYVKSTTSVIESIETKEVDDIEDNEATDVQAQEITVKAESDTSNSDIMITSAGIFTSPMEKRIVKPRTINLDEYTIGVIRNTIEDYHKEHHRYPTLLHIKNTLKERIQFCGSISTLRRLLRKLGCKWRINNKIARQNTKQALTEKDEHY